MNKLLYRCVVLACAQRYLNLGEWLWWVYGALVLIDLSVRAFYRDKD